MCENQHANGVGVCDRPPRFPECFELTPKPIWLACGNYSTYLIVRLGKVPAFSSSESYSLHV